MKIVRRVGICILTAVVLLLIGLFGVVRIVEFGPSKTARNLFVNSAMESSAGGILVTLFFSDEEIARIRAINSIQKTDEVTDSSLISDTTILTQEEKSMIEVIDIEKDTYRGKMMIVRDPSRVMVGTSGEYGKSCKGKKVSEIAESYGAIAATNAGGFRDAGGVGTGGEPDGLVISEGRLKWGSLGTTYGIIGIDNNNVLVVGDMTAQAALDRGVRDAVSFGPVLVVNGEAVEVNGSGSGLNPRTAIGQRADGAILLLVTDGRGASGHLGATASDLISVMQEYGAVNAANLDGGSSSTMVYNGGYEMTSVTFYYQNSSWKLPTAFVVMPK